MKRETLLKLSCLVLLFTLFLGTGCGTFKSVYTYSAEAAKSVSDKIRPGQKPILRKKVLLAPILNQAGVRRERAAQITETLADLLRKDKSLIVTIAETTAPSRAQVRSPEYGVVIDPALVKRADELGMNVLITLILNPFEVRTRKTGIWPFRKIRDEVEISVSLNAMDIINGTLFLTNLESQKIRLDKKKTDEEEEMPEEFRPNIDDKTLDKTLRPILKEQSSLVLKTLRYQPWEGKIALNGDSIRISAGKDIGITEGSIFDVYGEGESIRSVNGREYSFLGTKIGEIRTEKVFQDHSLAVALNGGRFENGQVIRLKR